MVGNQESRGNGSVPPVDATPARFHGPMMRYVVRLLATKVNPNPPEDFVDLPVHPGGILREEPRERRR